MNWDAGTTTVSSAGSRVQISNTKHRIKSIAVKARIGNTGKVYFGVSDVSSTNGWELQPGESLSQDFGAAGSESFDIFYVDAATSGDDLDWVVIIG